MVRECYVQTNKGCKANLSKISNNWYKKGEKKKRKKNREENGVDGREKRKKRKGKGIGGAPINESGQSLRVRGTFCPAMLLARFRDLGFLG